MKCFQYFRTLRETCSIFGGQRSQASELIVLFWRSIASAGSAASKAGTRDVPGTVAKLTPSSRLYLFLDVGPSSQLQVELACIFGPLSRRGGMQKLSKLNDFCKNKTSFHGPQMHFRAL